MTTTDHDHDAAIERARDFYNSELRTKLESSEKGKYVVIDGNSLDYEVDASQIVATVHLRDRRPNARMVVFKIADDFNWLTRPRRDASRPGTTTEESNGDFGKKITPPEISRSPASLEAEAFYKAELRAALEQGEQGKFIIIDPESSDYEVDSDLIAAVVHLQDRHPDAEAFLFRIGYDSGQFALHGFPISIK